MSEVLSFPRKRESRKFNQLLDPRLRGDDLEPDLELLKALKTPDVMERIRVQAYDIWTLTPGEFAAFLRVDHAKWGKIVKFSGAKAN